MQFILSQGYEELMTRVAESLSSTLGISESQVLDILFNDEYAKQSFTDVFVDILNGIGRELR